MSCTYSFIHKRVGVQQCSVPRRGWKMRCTFADGYCFFCFLCSCMSDSGQGRRRPSHWAPRATTTLTWCPSSSCPAASWCALRDPATDLFQVVQDSVPLDCRLAEVMIAVAGPFAAGHSALAHSSVADHPILLASFRNLQPLRLMNPQLQPKAPSGSLSVPGSAR